MLTTTRLTSPVEVIKKGLLQMSRHNYSKGEVIKRMMKEQKESFGALLETKKQKTRRLKREKLGFMQVHGNSSNRDDSEFSWMMKVSEDRLRRIRLNSEEKTEPQDLKKSRLDDFDPSSEEQIFRSSTCWQLPRVQKTIIRRSSVNQKKFTFTIVDKDYVPVSKVRTRHNFSNATSEGQTNPISHELTENAPVKNSKSTIDLEKSNIDLEKSNIDLEKSNIDLEKSNIHLERSNADIKRGLVSSVTLLSPVVTKIVTMASKPKKITSENKTLIKKSKAINCKVKSGSFKTKRLRTAKPQSTPMKPEIICSKPEIVIPATKLCTEPHLNSQIQNILENIKTAELYTETYEVANQVASPTKKSNLEFLRFPNVTTVLNTTMSSQAKNALKLNFKLLVEAWGQNAIDIYKKDVIQSNELFHSAINCRLRNLPYEVPPDLELCVKSVQPMLQEINDVKVIESHIIHQNLGYRGVLDCVASFRGNLCLIKWKTRASPSRKATTFSCDYSLHIAAYAGALNADKNNPFKIKSGVLVTAYKNGSPPLILHLDEEKLQFCWKMWLERLQKYYEGRCT